MRDSEAEVLPWYMGGSRKRGKHLKKSSVHRVLTYIDSSCAVDRTNCSLVTPVSRQMQSDSN